MTNRMYTDDECRALKFPTMDTPVGTPEAKMAYRLANPDLFDERGVFIPLKEKLYVEEREDVLLASVLLDLDHPIHSKLVPHHG